MSKDYKEVYAYLDDLEVKAYNRGRNDVKREILLSGEYERAYQRGLEDAWDAAQKISQYTWDWHTVCECFPENRGQAYALIFGSNTAQEAIDKIKKYEEKIKQARDDTRPYYANEWTPQDSLPYTSSTIYVKPQESEEQ